MKELLSDLRLALRQSSFTQDSSAFQKANRVVCCALTQVFVPHSLMLIGLQKRLRLRLKPPDPKESKF
jgi:hypothetical protein